MRKGCARRSSPPPRRPWAWVILVVVPILAGCGERASRPEVIVYTSVDRPHAEPVLEAFERDSGIRVRAVYDVEAAKTTGLVNRIRAEASRPRADVFWNGEFVQTLALATEGFLAPSDPALADPLPSHLRDPEARWFALAGRTRVLLVNADRVAAGTGPTSVEDLASDRWPASQVGLAHPLFGTTLAHAAALRAAWGPSRTEAFYASVRQRGVRVLPGNAAVRDLVARGTLFWGVTDTDDAAGALARGDPVDVAFPGQAEGEGGAFFIPGTAARVRGGPNPEAGLRFLAYLLGTAAEARLVEGGWCHVPLRARGARPRHLDARGVRLLRVDLWEVYENLAPMRTYLTEVFVR